MDVFLVFSLLTGFISILAGILLLGRHSLPRRSFAGQAVSANGIPIRRHAVLFSKAERSFYKALRSLVPDHMIFVKVKLSDLISVRQPQSIWEHFSALNRKHLDFVVCDPTMAPVLAIELDDVKNHSQDGATADLVNTVLAQAAVPVLHVPQKPNYLLTELRRFVAPYLAVPRPLL